jgi:SRSO17 transposase
MSATTSAPGGAQQERFAAYLEGLAQAAGHADRVSPLKSYCTGLLLPGERKSVEPMAARMAPHDVRRMHQSLHHVVAQAPWSDEALLRYVRESVLPAMEKHGPIVAWIVDDTGLPKKGTHSAGVARQYCGQSGKTESCQVAVSLSAATWTSSLPLAWRLYLPESWTKSKARMEAAGIPEGTTFQTKPAIALTQIRAAIAAGVPRGVVLGDPAYGNGTEFRQGLTDLELLYVLGIESTTSLWPPGQQPLPPAP